MFVSNILAIALSLASSALAVPMNHHHRVAKHKRADVTATTDSTSSSPAIAADSRAKFVVAHFMVGNAYPYTKADWSDDIIDAHNGGIDGFALNIGKDTWTMDRVKDAYDAAQDVAAQAPGFKFFFSFDMAVIPGNSPDDAAYIRNFITTFCNHPSQFKYEGLSYASTFSGQDATFGRGSSEAGWQSEFKDALASAGCPVHFVPSFFVAPERMAGFTAADGAFSWDASWPVASTNDLRNSPAPASGLPSGQVDNLRNAIGSLEPDLTVINAITARKTYMAALSPWFFTHYGADTYNKNWLYSTDDNMFAKRWENLIANREKIDVVEIITWNDYGESSYIGHIKGAQPNSEKWVTGYTHAPWLDLNAYYSKAFKTGSWPTVTEDFVLLAARPHTKDATCNDPIGRPTGWELVEDSLWAVVITASPAQVTLATSDSTSKTFNVGAGVTKLSIPLSVGGYMHAVVARNGQTVIDLKPADYTFTANPEVYNYNAYVASKKSTEA